ncbi:MAG: tRNA 2-thiouridine(34) synthase MnmA [Clostridiales bacterium]|nr:tRNA 2-thiouridine(34) synthase MnmA [Clostridiales bacterium]
MSGSEGKRALVAMSGGVDSSVAALLAGRDGYECAGATMKLVCTRDGSVDADGLAMAGEASCFYTDVREAARVAKSLGMPHHVFDFTAEFRERVIEPFVSAYESGATPNPCIFCNMHIKFGLLLEQAEKMGFDKLVTGHYARIVTMPDGSYRLARARDADKDQSYFLYGLTQRQLACTLFPLGGLTKDETRAAAGEAGFVNAGKRESQDICFVAEGGYAGFIEAYRGSASAQGDFVDTNGRVLGRHGGIVRYTIGQRKGLGLALGHPVFVKEIRPETGEVVLAAEEELFSKVIRIADANLPPGVFGALRAQIMVRYNAKPAWATVRPGVDGLLTAEFDEPVRAPARGQAAVMYDGDIVVGGGLIV